MTLFYSIALSNNQLNCIGLHDITKWLSLMSQITTVVRLKSCRVRFIHEGNLIGNNQTRIGALSKLNI